LLIELPQGQIQERENVSGPVFAVEFEQIPELPDCLLQSQLLLSEFVLVP